MRNGSKLVILVIVVLILLVAALAIAGVINLNLVQH